MDNTYINYIEGDATVPIGEGSRVIAHVCNDVGAWGKGFVLALSAKWRRAELDFRRWYKGNSDLPFELGQVQFCSVTENIWIANMVAQHGLYRKGTVIPLCYHDLHICLEKVADFCYEHHASVHMPRIGCGLAGGDWDTVQTMIVQIFASRDINVFVYDLSKKYE